MPVTFDLFGTLVEQPAVADPADAVARELEARGCTVPADWPAAYTEAHVDAPEGAEVPLHVHVAHALADRGVAAADSVVRRAVVAAFDPDVTACEGALEAVQRAREYGSVGLLSNCAVPELARRSLLRANLRWQPATTREPLFDVVVTSSSCGWRKPHRGAFEAVAGHLDCAPAELVHVGDSDADAGVEALGGRFIDIREQPLATVNFHWD